LKILELLQRERDLGVEGKANLIGAECAVFPTAHAAACAKFFIEVFVAPAARLHQIA
jgi:hypothetical protein